MSGFKSTNAPKQAAEQETATTAQSFYTKPPKKSMREKLTTVHSTPSKRTPLSKKEQECCSRATD